MNPNGATGPAPTEGSVTAAVNAKTDAQTPPEFLRPNFERMPPELTRRPIWVLWVPVWNGSKWTKRPIQPSGFGASTTNPKHWSSFDEVKKAYERAVQRGYVEFREKGRSPERAPIGGVGFAIDGQPDENGLVFAGVDFDKVISGNEIASLAQERIKRLGSYTERSVSGSGLHTIVKARPLECGVAYDGVEMYTSGRYFTMTGHAPENARIIAAPDEFAALAEELRAESTSSCAGKSTRGGKANEPTAPATNVVRFKLPEWAINTKPPAEFAFLPVESLAGGLETNIEEIRSAVLAIPPSAISTEPEWTKFARALAHEAAIYKDQAEQLWELLDTASRPAPGYNEADNRSRWLRHIDEAFKRENPITIATVFYLAKNNGWQGWSPPVTATASGPVVWSPAELKVSFSNIPHRRWLYSVDLVRGDITLIGSPGGAGKTSLAIGMAVSIAIGRPLFDEKIFGGDDLRVLYINAEDSGIEMRRRIWALCLKHNIAEQDLNRLYVAGTDNSRVQCLSFLRTIEKNSSVLDQSGFEQLEGFIIALQPDLIVLDPLVALCGGGNINDNAAMSLVMQKLKRLAINYDCAVLIIHHTRKGGDLTSAEAISGASAIVNLARHTIMPVTMTDDEATKTFNILPSERFRYFKVIDAKSNLAPRSGDTPWYELCSFELPNAEPPVYPYGDRVQAIARINIPLSGTASTDPDEQKIRDAILDLVDRGKMIDGQPSPYSPSLAGAQNARSLLDDAMAVVRNATAPRQWPSGDLKAVTERAITKMKEDGLLVEGQMPSTGRFRRGRALRTNRSAIR